MRPVSDTGREFGRAFHAAVVQPLLAQEMPGLRYAAARLGSGSDVLGLDDAMSRDHDWGCRLTLLVDEADRAAIPRLDGVFAARLPERFHGLPTRFMMTWNPVVAHQIYLATVRGFATERLGVDPFAGLSTVDWLTLTGQSVLEVTAGPVYHDSTAELKLLKDRLSWYPPDVERYVLACGWQRLAQRLQMVGRTAQTGQPLQSRLLSADLVGDLMGLAYLLHRRWQPYEKWREAMLPGADVLSGPLARAVTADDWRDRESALVDAIGILLAWQRDWGLPTPEPAVVPFWDRPYRTVADTVPAALLADITDPALVRLPVRAGRVDQWADCVDVLAHGQRRSALSAMYEAWT
jgi:hypothetical protein